MLRAIFGALLLFALIVFPVSGCQNNEPVPVETGPKMPTDLVGVYTGSKAMKVDAEQVDFVAEMKVGFDNRVESLYWQEVRNKAYTDDVRWSANNACEFVRTHYAGERGFQQTKVGETRIRRRQSRLDVTAALPQAQEINELRFEYDYPPGAVEAYELGGQLNWDPVGQCLSGKVFTVVPQIPATPMPRGSFIVGFGKARILKVVPGPQAMPSGSINDGPNLAQKKLYDFKRVQLTHAPGVWFIDAFNVDARVGRQGVIEMPDTGYALELVEPLRWEATVKIYADGRALVLVPDHVDPWEMRRQR